jgi:polysaccharide export outer membrane protein
MKRFIIVIMLLMVLLAAGPVLAEDYRLGPGDVLAIGVYGYEELQVEELIVRPDGKIAFPLVGEVDASGMTTAELTSTLSQSLSQYLKSADVTVNIVKFRTTRVYILGEVSKPGMYEIEKQHNLLDAIGMAGGYTRFAIKSKVYVVQKETGKYQVANLSNLLKKGDLSQNYMLNEGDVVYLASNKINFVTDILPFITAIYQINDMRNN